MSISKEAICRSLSQVGLDDIASRLEEGVDTIQLRAGVLFVTKYYSEIDDLAVGWGHMQSLVAAALQANLEVLKLPADLAWDLYLIILCKEPVPESLRLEILDDKFCCKKYVFQAQNEVIDWAAISQEVPLLGEWGSQHQEADLHPGMNRETVLQRLTERRRTPLATVMRDVSGFLNIVDEELVSLLSQKHFQEMVGDEEEEA